MSLGVSTVPEGVQGRRGPCTRADTGDTGCTASKQDWESLLAEVLTNGNLMAPSEERGQWFPWCGWRQWTKGQVGLGKASFRLHGSKEVSGLYP